MNYNHTVQEHSRTTVNNFQFIGVGRSRDDVKCCSPSQILEHDISSNKFIHTRTRYHAIQELTVLLVKCLLEHTVCLQMLTSLIGFSAAESLVSFCHMLSPLIHQLLFVNRQCCKRGQITILFPHLTQYGVFAP